jgi:predicted DNA-binding transcriptional regulator YafY
VRAGRLVELLLLLQMRGRATAPELAEALEVSVRTVYRDIDALASAGVPLYTETGRNGGVRLAPGYRVGGLPALAEADARGALLTAVPAIARDLGIDPDVGERTLLTALDRRAEAAARSLRDRLLVEPDDWFRSREPVPCLLDVARAVWEARELRITYRDRSQVVRPLGLVLKGPTWYLLGRRRAPGDTADRIYRVGRISEASVLAHRFEHPRDFDLAAAWARRAREFAASIPTYHAEVRVAPTAEALLGLLQEGTPPLPLAPDTPRDAAGWALLRLRFERPDSAARLLLQLGPLVEVLGPAELRSLVADAARGLSALYAGS